MYDAFQSQIRTDAPFKENFLRRASMAPQVHREPSQSRSAFARALSDQTGTDIRNTFDEQNRAFRQKSEEARARDVQAARERQTTRYGMDREREVTRRQQDNRRDIARADLSAYMDRARKDYKLNRMSNLVNLLLQGGMFVQPSASSMYKAWSAARPIASAAEAASSASGLGSLFSGGAAGAGMEAAGSPSYYDLYGGAPVLSGLR